MSVRTGMHERSGLNIYTSGGPVSPNDADRDFDLIFRTGTFSSEVKVKTPEHYSPGQALTVQKMKREQEAQQTTRIKVAAGLVFGVVAMDTLKKVLIRR